MTWGSRLIVVAETSGAQGLWCCRGSSIFRTEVLEEEKCTRLQGIICAQR
uniref:Uncharacterized protein n=1 Tax=Arundo donax TaxID=35708 RepID=A0A0A9FGA3_ARUDO